MVISQLCLIDISRILFRSCAVMETWLVSLRPSCQMSNKCCLFLTSRNKIICSKQSWTVSGCIHTKSNAAMKMSTSHSFSTGPCYDTATAVVDTSGNDFCSAQLFGRRSPHHTTAANQASQQSDTNATHLVSLCYLGA